MSDPEINLNIPTRKGSGIDLSYDEVFFENSLMNELLKKDPVSRTENDLKDLRAIISNIDFVK